MVTANEIIDNTVAFVHKVLSDVLRERDEALKMLADQRVAHDEKLTAISDAASEREDRVREDLARSLEALNALQAGHEEDLHRIREEARTEVAKTEEAIGAIERRCVEIQADLDAERKTSDQLRERVKALEDDAREMLKVSNVVALEKKLSDLSKENEVLRKSLSCTRTKRSRINKVQPKPDFPIVEPDISTPVEDSKPCESKPCDDVVSKTDLVQVVASVEPEIEHTEPLEETNIVIAEPDSVQAAVAVVGEDETKQCEAEVVLPEPDLVQVAATVDDCESKQCEGAVTEPDLVAPLKEDAVTISIVEDAKQDESNAEFTEPDQVVASPKPNSFKTKTIKGQTYLSSGGELFEAQDGGVPGQKVADLVKDANGRTKVVWL